jgi:hypothetical protein
VDGLSLEVDGVEQGDFDPPTNRKARALVPDVFWMLEYSHY